MRMTPLKRLLPHVLPQVLPCPSSMALDALQFMAVGFCTQTEVWSERFQEPLAAGDAVLCLSAPGEAVIVRVRALWLDGSELSPSAYSSECIAQDKADAQRAEAAADSAGKSADHAEGSALAAQKAAAAADASAKDANLAAEQAVAAQQAAADRDYVAGVAADVEQAVRDVAVDMLTPQVVSEAIDKATAEAQAHAQAAADSAAAAEATLKETKDSATEAARQANLAKTRADRAESAAQAAEDAARAADCAASRAAQKAEDIMARMADGVTVAWTSDEAIPQGELLPLPQNCGYYPGHHAVSLSWDGLVCHVGRQFEEVGEPGLLSHAVRLLFAAPALSDWQARICAHVDAPAAGDEASMLEERLAAIERNLSRLDREAVRFTADDTATP